MNIPNTANTAKSTRQLILQAAEERFRHFGYNKTTMAEIADDVNMSTANLYRYFKNKLDIAADCAARCIEDRNEALRDVVRNSKLSVCRQLEEFILTMLRYTYSQTADHPKINELVDIIATERRDIILEKDKVEQALIAEILSRGNESGEFDISDVISTARTLHAALIMFRLPLFMTIYSLDILEGSARDMAHLLSNGLIKK